MSEYVFKLPDLGEGTVEAEIVEWHVNVGDEVREGDVIVDVMTDKANVEVPAPVAGKVLRTRGEPGDVVAVGAELIALERTARGAKPPQRRRGAEPVKPRQKAQAAPTAELSAELSAELETEVSSEPEATPEVAPGSEARGAATQTFTGDEAEDHAKVITSPAIRRRAKEAGVDLRRVAGSGPRGRILRRDLDAHLTGASAPGEDTGSGEGTPAAKGEPAGGEFEEIKVIGIRRVIAERTSQSKREIPHFAYVEEVDVTELEALRRHLNAVYERRLTVLSFIAIGLIRSLEQFPQCNARFDAEAGVLQRFRPVHLGIATQTPDGLKVPVARHAQRLDLWQLTAEIARVAAAAREGHATRSELTGSTITVTSLGAMGGIVTTPVINYPEVAIVGVNKIAQRPVVVDGQVRVRAMMNLSSCFDHRFIDGYDAAAMIQGLKSLLENPGTLFLKAP